MFNLDLRTLVLVSSLFNFTMTVYLFAVWINNRRQFRGIGLYVCGMVLMTFGNFGLRLQDY